MEFIQTILDTIDGLVSTFGENVFENLGTAMSPVFKILVGLSIALISLNWVMQWKPMGFNVVTGFIMRVVIITGLFYSWTNFNEIYFAISSSSNEFSTMAQGVFFDGDVASPTKFLISYGETIDTVAAGMSSLVRAFVAGLMYCALGLFSASYVVVIGLTKLLLGIIIGFAPISGTALLFDKTRNLFEAWLGAAVGYVLMAPIASIAFALVVYITSKVAADLSGVEASSGGFLALLGVITMTIVGTMVFLQIPTLASSLTGQFGMQSISGGTGGVNALKKGASMTAGIVGARAGSFATGFAYSKTPRQHAIQVQQSWSTKGSATRSGMQTSAANISGYMQSKFTKPKTPPQLLLGHTIHIPPEKGQIDRFPKPRT